MRKEGTFKFWELISQIKVDGYSQTVKIFLDSAKRYMK
jgi:hypothetical protein